MKARTIIERAFAEVVQSSYEPESVNMEDGLRYLNRMMAKLEVSGIEVGYTSLSSVDDHISTPNTVVLGMVKNLALILWPQYNIGPVNPLIKFSADRSLNSMRCQAIDTIQPAKFPATLPRGSGNQDGRYSEPFYTNNIGVSTYIEAEND